MSEKMKSIVICTVVRTAQLDCAVINSKPLSHEYESVKHRKNTGKTPVKHRNLTMDGWINVLAQ